MASQTRKGFTKSSFDFNPIKWTRTLTFIALLALDFQHTYEFILSLSSGKQASELVPIFGGVFSWAGVSMTNGVFDALAYAGMITATIFFMSNTLAKRLAHNHPSLMYYAAMVVAVLVSALTNAGTMFYGATGSLIIPAFLLGPTAATLGGIITAGLLMFASMDAWDMKARVQKAAATRQRNQAARDVERMAQLRKEKFTPAKYKAKAEA